MARLVDVLPTLCDLLGIEPESPTSGASLLAETPAPVSAYSEALSGNLDYGWAPLRGVISKGKKLIQLPLPELYDLALDPGERRNLVHEDPQTAHELAALLPVEAAWPPRVREAGHDETEGLRARGYVVGGELARQDYTEEDDPKTLVDLDRKMTTLPRLYSLGRIDEAIEVAREVVERRPGMTLGRFYLARLLLARGEPEEAVRILEDLQRPGHASREVLVQLSLALTQAGRPDKAQEMLGPLLALDPEPDVLDARASALIVLGRLAEAAGLLEQALALDPGSVSTLELLSALALEQARYEDARRFAEQALAIESGRADCWNNLGVALYFLGSRQEAIRHWETAVRLAPQHAEALLSLGVVKAELGLVAEARHFLQRFMVASRSPRYAASRRQAEQLLRQLGAG